MKQREVFRAGEGNEWFRRNAEAITPEGDPVLKVLADIKPKRLLEVGCSNGWRLAEAHRLFGSACVGVDPSTEALRDGMARFASESAPMVTVGMLRYPHLTLKRGTAERLPVEDQEFDCVVYGWCLYLCDRSDLFWIAAEADRVLAPGGHIVIYDFCTSHAYANEYKHREGVKSYKMDYSRLWSWHPHYVLWSHEVLPFLDENPDEEDNRLALSILKKLG